VWGGETDVPLEGKQLKAVADSVCQGFDEPGLQQLLRYQLNRRLDDVAPAGTIPDRVFAILDRAEAEGWLDEFVQAVWLARCNVPTLVGLLQSLNFPPPPGLVGSAGAPPTNPFDVLDLRRGQALIDRTDLREHLRRLAGPGPDRVLLVDGPPVTGKTYSIDLIKYLADLADNLPGQAFRFALIDLKETASDRFGPDDLARSVTRQIGRDIATMPPPRTDALGNKWVQELRDWVIEGVQQVYQKTGRTIWIVVDGFTERALPAETEDLVHHLARYADRNVPEMRVVLIGYRRPLPEINEVILREHTRLIDRLDLIEFFKKLFPQKGQAIDDDAAEALADAVLQDADARIRAIANPEERAKAEARRIEWLAREVRVKIQQLFP